MLDYAELNSWMEVEDIEAHFLKLATEALRIQQDRKAVMEALNELSFRADVRDHFRLSAKVLAKVDDCIERYWDDQDLESVKVLGLLGTKYAAPKSIELFRAACNSTNYKVAKYAENAVRHFDAIMAEAAIRRAQEEAAYRPPSGPLPAPQPKRGGKRTAG